MGNISRVDRKRKYNRNEVEVINSSGGYLKVKTERGMVDAFVPPPTSFSGERKRVSALYIETQSNKQANDAPSGT